MLVAQSMLGYERAVHGCRYLPRLSSSGSCYSTRQPVTRSRYLGRCEEETDGMAAEMEREQRLHTGEDSQRRAFEVEREQMRGERAESVEREPPAKRLYGTFV